MPVRRGKDSKGYYYRWGNQKKYYYKKGSKRSATIAKNKATKQGVAIKLSQLRRLN